MLHLFGMIYRGTSQNDILLTKVEILLTFNNPSFLPDENYIVNLINLSKILYP